jgi:cystathionine gamma-synthase
MGETSDAEAPEPALRASLGPGADVLKAAAFETLAIHAGPGPDEATGAVVAPIYAVSTYAQDSVANPHAGYVYGRGSNPTRTRLEERLAALENGSAAIAFASGMAAEDAVFGAVCRPGEEVIIPADVYGGTYRLLDKVFTRWGLTYVPVRQSDLRSVRACLTPGRTRLVWCETPTNPLLALADISAIAGLAHEAGALLAVDNTFASPYLQRPLDFGADIVVHSTTKYLAGHSDVIGGAVVTSDEALGAAIRFHQNATGAVPSPFDAWLTLRGIQTLAVRLSQQSATALFLATMLTTHPAVGRVYYPGLESHPHHSLAARQMSKFGGIVSFTLSGGEAAAIQVCNSARLFTLAESLGAVESLICHPLRMTHASASGSSVAPPPDLVRLSVGLEAPDDLASDLLGALNSI